MACRVVVAQVKTTRHAITAKSFFQDPLAPKNLEILKSSSLLLLYTYIIGQGDIIRIVIFPHAAVDTLTLYYKAAVKIILGGLLNGIHFLMPLVVMHIKRDRGGTGEFEIDLGARRPFFLHIACFKKITGTDGDGLALDISWVSATGFGS